MEIFNSEILYRIICAVSALTCAGMGLSLIRTKGVMGKLRRTFPEDMIPYHYISARRTLGFAYVFIGMAVLVSLRMQIPQQTEIFFPVCGLIVSSFQIIIATFALLSLYDSPLVNRRTVFANLAIFVLPDSVYAIFRNFPIVTDMLGYACCVLFFIQLVAYTLIFFMERRSCFKAMTDRMGADEAQYYSRKEVVALFILSLVIAIWSCTSFFFPTLGYVSLFMAVCTIYYVLLGIYFHNQWEDSTIVHEIISEANNKNR